MKNGFIRHRIGLLLKELKRKKFLRFLEVHNALSALIAEETKVEIQYKRKRKILEFDGFWESSFTDSASKGLPDIEIVSIDSRMMTINQIMEVTQKPMIVDGDTGGDINQFEYFVKKLERAGVSMVVIEDKVFPKRNSLEPGTKQELEDPRFFAEKIRRGQKIKKNKEFLIVARIESLIAGTGMKDAIDRCKIYLRAGADGILIHSRKNSPDEVLEFAKEFKRLPNNLIKGKVLVCIPTTYNTITENELMRAGFNIVIYANHLLRASVLAMEKVAREILIRGRSFEVEPFCASVKEIMKRVGFLEIKEKDKMMAEKFKSKIKVIIPAAGKDSLSEKYQCPKALIKINGKSILERQLETFKNLGLNNFIVIRGYKGELFEMENGKYNVKYYENKEYLETYIAHSLFCAEKSLNSPFIFVYSDILFDEEIIRKLLMIAEKEKKEDIVLVVDNSFQYHKHNIDKKLELVITKNKNLDPIRKVVDFIEEEVAFIGTKIEEDLADYEFIGIAYFSKMGAEILKNVYHDSMKIYSSSSFHEADNIQRASFADLIQEIIDRGYKVKVLKVYKGWIEIHDEEDLKLAEEIYKRKEGLKI